MTFMGFIHFTIHRKSRHYFFLLDVYLSRPYTSLLGILILDLPPLRLEIIFFILTLSRLGKIAFFSLSLCSFWHFHVLTHLTYWKIVIAYTFVLEIHVMCLCSPNFQYPNVKFHCS